MKVSTFKYHIREMGIACDEGIACLEEYFDKHAQVLLLSKDEADFTLDDEVSDFFSFCLTKSIKSLHAALVLMKHDYTEDALIILRTIYENYLSIEYATSHPAKLRYIFQHRLGYSRGWLKNVINSKGRPVKGQLLATATNEIHEHEEISVYALARASRFKYDKLVNEHLYKFLSEYVHPNMVASGNYRDEENKHYSYSKKDNSTQPIWISAYLITILLQQVVINRQIPSLEMKEYQKVLKRNVNRLCKLCSSTINSEKASIEDKEIMNNIKFRLEEELSPI